MKKISQKKHLCINCHFLTETIEILDIITTESVSPDHRKILKGGETALLESDMWKQLKCHKGFWKLKDDYRELNLEDLKKTLNENDRKDRCYFWKYEEDLPLKVAEKLQARQYAYQKWRLELTMAWIAIILTSIGAVFTILDFFCK